MKTKITYADYLRAKALLPTTVSGEITTENYHWLFGTFFPNVTAEQLSEWDVYHEDE